MSGRAALRSTTTSPDGTTIGWFSSGSGPPLVLVHGAPADHSRWEPLLPHLEPHFTAHAMDRRGRGASSDTARYALEREYEDVAAVVDAIAPDSGTGVDVYGHSFGGLVAFGAAALTSNIRRLVLYEGWPVTDPSVFALPEDVERRMDELKAKGDADGIIETLFRVLVQMPEDELAALKAAPSWAGRVAAAPTLTREIRAIVKAAFHPETAARIAVPVLLVTGEQSGEPSRADVHAVAAALPDARILELAGQQHVADILDPERFAAELLAFLR